MRWTCTYPDLLGGEVRGLAEKVLSSELLASDGLKLK